MTDKKITENKPDVPYIVFEGEMARAERYIKRLWTALIVAIASLAIAVIAFIIMAQRVTIRRRTRKGGKAIGKATRRRRKP